ncbi:ABC transporter permease [Roseivirga sp. UBA1976]|uniref:ABC transporter permease n=1 Tax=Roseivirga sp. UBA1976 TaxID=1947386 RepID=UPI00257BE383|nr:ABC transporter permease [Roseivirga sp. UBA1976]MEC7755179.1 ABC transporter permease [Bacteroidota bacterium]
MIRSYFKVAFRNLFKYKGYSFINIFGLTLGLCTSMLIFLYVQDEWSFDKMHDDAHLIYRLENWSQYEGNENHWAATQGFLIPEVVSRYPEIRSATRIYHNNTPETFSTDVNFYNEKDLFYADSTFFDVFTFPVLFGDLSTALDDPGNIVLTESTARKYFGRPDPIGEIIKRGATPFTVSAVIQDIPHNSHFRFDLLIPLSEFQRRFPQFVNGRGPSTFYSYVKTLNEEASKNLRAKLDADVLEIMNIRDANGEINPIEGLSVSIRTMPLTDIHLYGHAEKELGNNSQAQYIFIFSTVAVFILIIASFNYMNLATARSTKRSKEVGMRKVLGARKPQVFWQFLSESFFFTFIATLLALMAVVVLIPSFNDFTGKRIDGNLLNNGELLLSILLVYGAVSLLSGLYPSVFLSNFQPLKALKSNVLSGKGHSFSIYLRRGLVILQFGISILLIIGASTIYRQLRFIEKKDVGFNKEQVLVLKLPGRGRVNNLETIKQEFMADPSVVVAAPSSVIPGERVHIMTVRVPDLVTTDAGNESQQEDNGIRGMRIMSGDEDLAEVYGLQIVAGRDLSKEMVTDATQGFLLNEAAIREFGLQENPVGRRFEYVYGLPEPKAGQIVGVIKDFNYASVHTEVEPLMVHVMPSHAAYLNVRLSTDGVQETIKRLEAKWTELQPAAPFEYFFLDSLYDAQYKTEMSMGKTITFFTLLAIVIACMGLFGLASFITEQRTKEIGVRKVLGASISSIMVALSKEFVLLVLLANIMAAYPAYSLLNNWLSGFAYRVNISPVTFLSAAVVALLIAFITISFKTYMAARSNPVKALRHE